jgi:hypothetical protein
VYFQKTWNMCLFVYQTCTSDLYQMPPLYVHFDNSSSIFVGYKHGPNNIQSQGKSTYLTKNWTWYLISSYFNLSKLLNNHISNVSQTHTILVVCIYFFFVYICIWLVTVKKIINLKFIPWQKRNLKSILKNMVKWLKCHE